MGELRRAPPTTDIMEVIRSDPSPGPPCQYSPMAAQHILNNTVSYFVKLSRSFPSLWCEGRETRLGNRINVGKELT